MKTSESVQSGVGLFVDQDGLGPSIHTYSGRRFYVLNPRPEDVELEDIAESLAKLCRFNGHTRHHYSVAHHSILVADTILGWGIGPNPNSYIGLLGLLHDAAEVYMGDVTRPLKVALDQVAPGILRGIEDRIHQAILDRFGLDSTMWDHALIKDADNIVLATEMRDLLKPPLPGVGSWGHDLPDPLPAKIKPYTKSSHAAGDFLTLAVDLWEQMGRSPNDL